MPAWYNFPMREMLKTFAVPAFGALAVLIFLMFGPFSGGFEVKQPAIGKLSEKTTPITINGKPFKAFIANIPLLRERGLSGRESLEADEVMLFVFDYAAPHGFWMKDMLFPIDIMWVGENENVVEVKENVLPSSYPNVFVPRVAARFAVEARAGFVEENEIHVGDTIVF